MLFHALGSFAVVEQSERRLPPLRSVLSLCLIPVKTHATHALIAFLVTGILGCSSSYRHVMVSVIDSKTGAPVAGAGVGVHFHPRTRTVTGQDGTATLKLRPKEAQDPIFDVKIVNSYYDQNFGYSESRNEWMNRPQDFVPTKPDIVLEVTSRIDEQRAEEATQAKRKAAEQAAEKLFRESPDFWPERTNDVAKILFLKRWNHASVRVLGSKEDIDFIRAAIIGHMKHPKAEVGEIRWISATIVMAKSSWYTGPLAAAGYTYVLRKGDQGWSVLTCAMDYIS